MSEIYGQLISASGSSKPYTQITATFPSGTTNITLTGNGKTWPAVSTSGTENVYMVTDIGYTYTLSGSKDGSSKSESISVSQAFQDIRVELKFNPEWYTTLKSMSVGQTITIDSLTWLLVNKTNSAAVLGLDIIYSKTKFGSSTAYAGSTLASVAASFESQNLSTETKQYLNNVTVKNVTAKVFVPSYEQMNSGFSHYNSNANRRCQYNGSYDWYWTSSEYDSRRALYIGNDGSLDNTDYPSYTFGFRPHIEVNLTL